MEFTSALVRSTNGSGESGQVLRKESLALHLLVRGHGSGSANFTVGKLQEEICVFLYSVVMVKWVVLHALEIAYTGNCHAVASDNLTGTT